MAVHGLAIRLLIRGGLIYSSFNEKRNSIDYSWSSREIQGKISEIFQSKINFNERSQNGRNI